MPIGTTTRRAGVRRPGQDTWPIFGAWNVTVTSAETATDATSPVDASTPLGTSTATTGAPASPIARIASATAPRGSPLRPVPSSASTTTSAPRSPSPTAPTRETGTPAATADSLASSASPSYGREATTRHEASTPSARSRRAATRPSPPLAPPPQTQTTRRAAGYRTRTTCATASPAAAISCVPGTPAAIAAASVARIEAASCRVAPDQSCVPSHVFSFCRSPGTFDSSNEYESPSCRRDSTAVMEYTKASAAAGLVDASWAAGARPAPPARRSSAGSPGFRWSSRREAANPPVRTASSVASVGVVVAGCDVVDVSRRRPRAQRDGDDGEAEEDRHTDGTRILRAGSRIAACPVRSIA